MDKFENRICKNYNSIELLALDKDLSDDDIKLADIELDANLTLAVHRT